MYNWLGHTKLFQNQARSGGRCCFFSSGMTSSRDDDDYYTRRLLDATDVRRHYCSRHRLLLFDSSREQRMPERYEFSEDEKIVNSLGSSNSSCSSSCRRTTSRGESVGTSKEKMNNIPFTEEENQTTNAFERLSLSTQPRIVKPKDNLRRAATKKMLIYPPKGQQGEPLTLKKRRSKIWCRVNGDEDTGFRYEVEYLQTFVSDKWIPNERTNNPFRHHLDEDSTD